MGIYFEHNGLLYVIKGTKIRTLKKAERIFAAIVVSPDRVVSKNTLLMIQNYSTGYDAVEQDGDLFTFRSDGKTKCNVPSYNICFLN